MVQLEYRKGADKLPQRNERGNEYDTKRIIEACNDWRMSPNRKRESNKPFDY